MYDDKFTSILEVDEKIIWTSNVNVFNYIIRGFLSIFICIFWTLLLIFFLNKTFFACLLIMLICIVVLLNKNAHNTYFSITNKRIIKRYGIFKPNFVGYPILNIKSIKVTEKKILFKKEKTTNFTFFIPFDYDNGVSLNYSLEIKALNNAYEALEILTKLTKKNKGIKIKKPSN